MPRKRHTNFPGLKLVDLSRVSVVSTDRRRRPDHYWQAQLVLDDEPILVNDKCGSWMIVMDGQPYNGLRQLHPEIAAFLQDEVHAIERREAG